MITREQMLKLQDRVWAGVDRLMTDDLGNDIRFDIRYAVSEEDLPDLEARCIAAVKAFKGEKP